jgi:hypothetical protein
MLGSQFPTTRPRLRALSRPCGGRRRPAPSPPGPGAAGYDATVRWLRRIVGGGRGAARAESFELAATPEQLAHEQRVYEVVAGFLGERSLTLAQVEERVRNPYPDAFVPGMDRRRTPGGLTEVDLGFGATLISGQLGPAGYPSAAAECVLFEGELALAKVTVDWSNRVPPARFAAVRDRFEITGEGGYHRGVARSTIPELEARLDAARAALLGPAGAPDVPARLRRDFAEVTQGFRTSFAAGPVGVAATVLHDPLKAFYELGRLDLWRAILRGRSPEARIRAACELLGERFRGQLTPEDRAAIRVVRGLPLVITIMSGCTGFDGRRAADLIPEI